VLLGGGLSRARRISRWLAIPLGLSIGAMMPLRFGWQLGTLAILVAITLFLAWRASFRTTTAGHRVNPVGQSGGGSHAGAGDAGDDRDR
jgi:membrane protein implicated in regulation of membrane protease activity